MRIVVKILSTIVDSLLVDSLFTDPLFSLQSPSSARDKRETAGDLPPAQQGTGGGRRIFLSRAPRSFRALEKNKNKNKTTSVYKPYC